MRYSSAATTLCISVNARMDMGDSHRIEGHGAERPRSCGPGSVVLLLQHEATVLLSRPGIIHANTQNGGRRPETSIPAGSCSRPLVAAVSWAAGPRPTNGCVSALTRPPNDELTASQDGDQPDRCHRDHEWTQGVADGVGVAVERQEDKDRAEDQTQSSSRNENNAPRHGEIVAPVD
jgi:hypothetical protein